MKKLNDKLETEENTNKEYNLLVTRANTYQQTLPPTADGVISSHGTKKSLRKKHTLQCKSHYLQNWNRDCEPCSQCIVVKEDHLPNGKLPTLQVR